MTEPDKARETLTTTRARYSRTEDAHKKARDDLKAAVVDALRAGIGPSEVSRLSGFTDAYVRKLARAADLPPLRDSRGGAAPKSAS